MAKTSFFRKILRKRHHLCHHKQHRPNFPYMLVYKFDNIPDNNYQVFSEDYINIPKNKAHKGF